LRGDAENQSDMFSYLSPAARVPADHPLRPIRGIAIEALKGLSKDFDDWAERFQSLNAGIIRARERDPASLPAAEAKMTGFLADRRNLDIQRAFVRGTAARPLVAEVTFLLASAVHERAERATPDGSERTAGLWGNAREWWDRFLDVSAQAHSPLPAREAHGRAQKARCEQFSK